MLGAETVAGRAFAAALAAAGARTAIVAASAEAETAFAVQRLARRLGASASQAIDASNEMAVRVMTRQVSKALGGLDLLVFCTDLGGGTGDALALACRFGAREIARSGGGAIVVATAGASEAAAASLPEGVRLVQVAIPPEPDAGWAEGVLGALA